MGYMPSFRRDRQTDKTTGAELTFDYVVHRLAEVDFADAVKRLGFTPVLSGVADANTDTGEIEEIKGIEVIEGIEEMEIDFLGERYRLSKKGGVFSCAPVSGRADRLDHSSFNLNHKSVLCYYALSAARGEPLYDFCLVDHFAHGVFSSTRREAGSVLGGMTGPLAKALDGLSPEEQRARFAAAAERLGMKPLDGGGTGAARKWEYRLLPKMPVQVVFYEADDEFPPDLRVYWDKTAITVFDFEPLAVLNGCFIHALAENCR